MITEKFMDYYEYVTADEKCYETICEIVPETTTTFDYSSTESWTSSEMKITSDAFETYETSETTTDISTDTALVNQSKFDDSTNKNKTGNYTSEELTALVSNMTEKEQLELRQLCWETMFGQELVKLTVMDLVIERKTLSCI